MLLVTPGERENTIERGEGKLKRRGTRILLAPHPTPGSLDIQQY